MSRLTFTPGNHSYWLETDGKKQRVPSVSSLKTMLHPFHGERWYIDQAATATDQHFDRISALPPAMRADAIREAATAAVGYARDFGKAVHAYTETLTSGEMVEIPEQYGAHIAPIIEWFTREHVTVVHSETLCWSPAGDFGESPIAGTLDLLVKHPDRGLGLVDLKTWTPPSTGTPQPSAWAFQLAAYAAMEHLVVDGEDTPMPHVDWLSILHVGPGTLTEWTIDPANRDRAHRQVNEARALRNIPKPTMTGPLQ